MNMLLFSPAKKLIPVKNLWGECSLPFLFANFERPNFAYILIENYYVK